MAVLVLLKKLYQELDWSSSAFCKYLFRVINPRKRSCLLGRCPSCQNAPPTIQSTTRGSPLKRTSLGPPLLSASAGHHKGKASTNRCEGGEATRRWAEAERRSTGLPKRPVTAGYTPQQTAIVGASQERLTAAIPRRRFVEASSRAQLEPWWTITAHVLVASTGLGVDIGTVPARIGAPRRRWLWVSP